MVYTLISQFLTDSYNILFIILPAAGVSIAGLLPTSFFQILLAKHFLRLLKFLRLYKIH